jgi:hypothetical protein
MLPAVAARKLRRFNMMAAFPKASAFYAKAARPAT